MMNKYFFLKMLCISFILCLVVACSDSDTKDQTRKRRGDSKENSEKKSNDDNSTTTTKVPTADTTPIKEVPYSNTAKLKTKWNEAELCGLIAPDQAKEVLELASAPTPQYTHYDFLGSNCTWPSGNGKNIYIEISTSSYKDAREVDASLNAAGEPIIISGVAGVIKNNENTGSFIELNYSGEKSNQWIVNAPSEEQAKKLAEFLIAALKKS